VKKLTDKKIKKDYRRSIKFYNTVMIVTGTMTVVFLAVAALLPDDIYYYYRATFNITGLLFLVFIMMKSNYKYCYTHYFERRKIKVKIK